MRFERKTILGVFMALSLISMMIVPFNLAHGLVNTVDVEKATQDSSYDLASRKISITYRFPKPEIDGIDACLFSCPSKELYRGYVSVNMEGTIQYRMEGLPVLPLKTARILLPFGTSFKTVRVTAGRRIPLSGTYLVEYGTKSIPLTSVNCQDALAASLPNETVYGSSEPFPGELYSGISVQEKMGYTILFVNLHPMEYLPAPGKLLCFESIRLEVEVTSQNRHGTFAFNGYPQQRKIVEGMVDNPDVVKTYPTSELAPTYQYVIITNEELNNTAGPYNFQALRDDKISRGVSATIVTVEWIYANYDGTRPDGGQDGQTRIRNFIIDAYQSWGTMYVLLGGDGDGGDAGGESGDTIIPHRGFASIEGGDYDIPADMYYGCLNGTFDSDGDGIYGEPNDGEGGSDVDLCAEVYVGRACVDSQTEVQNFVHKILSYQTTTSIDLRKVWMVGEYIGFGGVAEWGGNYKDEIKEGSDAHGYTTIGFEDSIYASGFDVSTLYDRDYPGNNWPKSEVIDVINDNAHLINHLGHADVGYVMKMYNADVDASLTNEEVYFIGYSQGCYCGAFDDRDSYGSYTDYDCITEHLTTEAHGAVAFIANSRYGFGEWYSTDGPSQHFDREFWDAVLGEDIFNIGIANQDSKEDNIGRVSSSWLDRWCYYEINLFGDPELRIRLPPAYEHELDVTLEAPSLLKLGESSLLNATVRNRGLSIETDVELFLLINGTVVNSTVIAEFVNGTHVTIDYLWTPTADVVYNITVYAPPVPDEGDNTNNWKTRIATVITPPPEANWILLATDPDEGIGTSLKTIYGQLYSESVYFKVEHYRTWTTINDINTGIFIDADQDPSTGLPDGFYPGQSTGIGADYVIVVGFEATEMWRWDPVAGMWDVNNPISFSYLDAYGSSNVFVVGVYLASVETTGTIDCAVTDTMSNWDWMPDLGHFTLSLIQYEHELAVFLKTKQRLQPGETCILNATVHNFGLNTETDVEIQILINGSIVASETLDELVKGAWHTVNYSWTPTVEGIYNITAYAPPVPAEEATENNVLTQMVPVEALPDILVVSDDDGGAWVSGTSLREFESALTAVGYDYWVWNESSMGNPPLDFLTEFSLVVWTCGDYWSWAVDPTDAVALASYLAQGGNLLLEGEDIGYNHGSDSFMVNVAHATYQVDDTAALGLTVTDSTHPVALGLPTSFAWLTDPPFDDGVSPTNGGAEVIQYTGTVWTAVTVFEGPSSGSVVYCAFPLHCLAASHGETLAINSINWLLSVQFEHELAVELEAPERLELGDSALLNATVVNNGLNNEFDVQLFLLINDGAVDSETIPELLVGESYTISYSWTPMAETTYNVTAYAPLVPGETVTVNNVHSVYVAVSYAPKILAYVEYADYYQEYANALGAIDSTFGPGYILSELFDYTQLDSMLLDNDVLLVPEQEYASLATLFAVGASWSTTLSNFLAEGGIVIVCDFSGGSYGILTGAGLMSVSGVNYITGGTVHLVDPSDPLAEGVSNTFIAPNGAVSFVTSEANVVSNDGTYPVVIHKTVGSGHIALIGFDYFESNADANRVLGNAVGLWAPTPTYAYLVVRGFDNRIYYHMCSSSGSPWEEWNVVPTGTTCDSPAAAVCCGRLHIVVRGMDGYSIWYGWINLTDNSFYGWTWLSGATPSAPKLASNGTAINLAVRGFDDRIYCRSYDCISHSWEEWNAVPTGATCDSPAVEMVGDDLHVVVRGMDGYSLWHGCLTNPADPGSFSGWTWLSGATPSAPTLSSSGSILYLAVQGFDYGIYYRIFEGTWGDWKALSGGTCDSPAAAMVADDLHVVVRGADGNTLWHEFLDDPSDPGSCSDWCCLSGATPSAPTLAVEKYVRFEWMEQWSYTYGADGHSQFAQPIGDIDEDGVNEIIVGGYETLGIGMARILSYDAIAGTYVEEYSWTHGGGVYNAPSGATVVDLDDNGDLELVVSWAYSGVNDGVWAYDWDGVTLVQLDHYYASFVFDVYTCDYDDDGDLEVLIANAPWGGTPYHVIALGWQGGQFVEEATWLLEGYSWECPMIWSGDTDDDDKTEVIVVISDSYYSTAGVWALSWNQTSNEWEEQLVYAGPFSGTPYGVAVGDIDGDGTPEIGVGNNVGGYVGAAAYLFEWDGTSYSKVWEGSWSGEYCAIEAIAIGDADNDGKNEFCVGGGHVHIIEWTGTGYAETATITETAGLLAGLIIGDCDSDGLNEIKACDILGYGPGKEWIFKYSPVQ